MSDYDNVKFFIQKLYKEKIEIKELKMIGWYYHHYGIIKPDDMKLDKFLLLCKKIQNDYPETKLKIVKNNMYCEITNEDLNTIDKMNLQIVILTNDLYCMEKTCKKMMSKKSK